MRLAAMLRTESPIAIGFCLLVMYLLSPPATVFAADPQSAGSESRATSEPAVPHTGIHPWLDVGSQLVADVSIDGKSVGTIDYRAANAGIALSPAATFVLPPGARILRLRGQLTPAAGKPRSFDTTWALVDIGAYTKPLYDTTHGVAERILGYTKRLQQEAERSMGEFISPISMKPAPSNPTAALDAAEARLKLRLPPPLRDLGRYRIDIGDSYFLEPAKLATVTQLLLGDWSYTDGRGENNLRNILSPETRVVYDRSVAVFVEVGDGLGALAWDPKGTWFWFHQDELNRYTPLVDAAGKPWDDEAALLNAVQRFGVDSAVEELSGFDDTKGPSVMIDSSHPRGLLQLHFEDGGRKPKLWLRSYDYHQSMK